MNKVVVFTDILKKDFEDRTRWRKCSEQELEIIHGAMPAWELFNAETEDELRKMLEKGLLQVASVGISVQRPCVAEVFRNITQVYSTCLKKRTGKRVEARFGHLDLTALDYIIVGVTVPEELIATPDKCRADIWDIEKIRENILYRENAVAKATPEDEATNWPKLGREMLVEDKAYLRKIGKMPPGI
jgi:hypothetical protein